MEKKQLDNLAKRYTRAKAYESITKAEGWEEVKSDWEKEAYLVGKMAVYPGYKVDVLSARLMEARLLLKRIRQIESLAKQAEHLKKQLEEVA